MSTRERRCYKWNATTLYFLLYLLNLGQKYEVTSQRIMNNLWIQQYTRGPLGQQVRGHTQARGIPAVSPITSQVITCTGSEQYDSLHSSIPAVPLVTSQVMTCTGSEQYDSLQSSIPAVPSVTSHVMTCTGSEQYESTELNTGRPVGNFSSDDMHWIRTIRQSTELNTGRRVGNFSRDDMHWIGTIRQTTELNTGRPVGNFSRDDRHCIGTIRQSTELNKPRNQDPDTKVYIRYANPVNSTAPPRRWQTLIGLNITNNALILYRIVKKIQFNCKTILKWT